MHEIQVRHEDLISKCILLIPLSKESIRFTLVKMYQDLSGIKIEVYSGQVVQFVGVWPCTRKDCRFNSWLGCMWEAAD